MSLKDILNQQPYGISELTADQGHFVYFNAAEQKMRGLSDIQMQSVSIFDLFPAEESEELKTTFQRCAAASPDDVFFFEYQHNKRDMQMRLVKKEQHILSTLTDITQQRRLEAQHLQDQETIKCLNDAVNGANIGCWDFYPQEKRIIANKAWVTQKYYKDEDFREDAQLFSEVIDGLDRWASFVHPEDLDATVALIEKHLAGETEVYDAKFRVKCGDGKWRWIHDLGKVFERDEQGTAIRMNGVHIDITEARTLEERIEKLAVTDALTGLFNRHNFEELSKAVMERAQRQQSCFCLLLLDVDHFKAYNDTYGHVKGDDVLEKISRTLRSNIRQADDYCFRVGGEEFAVIFTEDSPSTARQIAERIKSAVEGLAIPHQKNSASEFVTVSMGLSYTEVPNLSVDIDLLYQNTDLRLYQAKSEGRNRLICD